MSNIVELGVDEMSVRLTTAGGDCDERIAGSVKIGTPGFSPPSPGTNTPTSVSIIFFLAKARLNLQI